MSKKYPKGPKLKVLWPQLEKKLGTSTAHELVDILFEKICVTRVHGKYGKDWNEKKGVWQKRVYATFTKEDANKKIMDLDEDARKFATARLLSKKKIVNHFLSEDPYRWIWYFNRAPVVNGKRNAYLMFDIDCHHGQEFIYAQELQDRLSKLFICGYWSVSTSGTGIHFYILVSWDESDSNQKIGKDIDLLQRTIAQATKNDVAVCDEIKGKPMIYNREKKIVKYGLWARIPRPSDPDEAEDMLTSLEYSYDFSYVFSSLCSLIPSSQKIPSAENLKNKNKKRTKTRKSSSAHSSSKNTAPSSSSKEQEKTNRKGGGKRGYSYRGEMELSSLETRIDKLRSIPNTFTRTLKFIKIYRPAAPHCSMESAYQRYCFYGVNVGNSDEREFERAWEFSNQSWDPNQKGGLAGCRAKSELIINTILGDGANDYFEEELEERRIQYRLAGCAESTIESLMKINKWKLINFYACMMWHIGKSPTRTATFGKEHSEKMMKDYCHLNMGQREFKAMIEWLLGHNLISLAAKHFWSKGNTGRCRTFTLLDFEG